ncbi:MAG: GNAT family N-acetyltransferase [Armatimonadota bacterium]
MRPPETIQTERLILRKPRLDDAEAIFADYAQDPDVTRYLTWASHTDISQTRAFLEVCLAGWEAGERFSWAITLEHDDAAIGMIEVAISDYKAALGYVLAKAYWGRGLMAEAAGAIANWTIAQPEIFRVWAVCDVRNPASARVMEKCGMSYEGTLKRWMRRPTCAEPVDCLCYSMTK